MTETETRKLVTFTVTATEEQLEQLNEAWKSDKKSYNRSDFVREAINVHSGRKIF